MSAGPITFPQALARAEEVLKKLDRSLPGDDEAKQQIAPFFESEAAIRGFFVVLLTGDFRIADEAPAYLIESLRSAPRHVLSVLTKNLVMSAATAVVHQRSGDQENLAGSQKVVARTTKIVGLMQDDKILSELKAMRSSLSGQADVYAEFLSRVNYDQEQLEAASDAVEKALAA
jgi:hypothetical protein